MSVGRLSRLGFVALLACVVSCAAEQRPKAPSEPLPQPAPREHWPRFEEVLSYAPVNTTPFATRGHLEKPSYAIVRVSPEVEAQYLSLVTDSVLADGAVIAMFHQSRDGAQSGLVYAMEKKANEWTFLALDADGGVVAENLNVCALCHRGGVADHLFGLPRSLTADAGGAGDQARPSKKSAAEWDGGEPR